MQKHAPTVPPLSGALIDHIPTGSLKVQRTDLASQVPLAERVEPPLESSLPPPHASGAWRDEMAASIALKHDALFTWSEPTT